jgi:hypothetical protein
MPDEAVLALHQMASIDRDRGGYEEARQKFESAREYWADGQNRRTKQ